MAVVSYPCKQAIAQVVPDTTPAPAPAASPAPKPAPAFYRNLLVLDPAHGGPDSGAQLPDNIQEKDVTLAFAQRLRPALVAQGFTVVSTRDSDSATPLSNEQRSGVSNHVRPLACIQLHATATGTGIHVATSSLTSGEVVSSSRAVPWATAQAQVAPVSLRLANEIGLSLLNSHLPVVLLRASVSPIDNLICPAVAVELAPLAPTSGNPSPVTDVVYQQRVVEAIVNAISSFRAHNAPQPLATPASPLPKATSASGSDSGVAK
jgi:N-acetylmuramoyl-L-alanine amidase